jgi:primosomal protein N'
VVAGEEANTGDYSYAFCSKLDVRVGRFLNVKTPYDRKSGIVFSDEDDFEERIQEVLEDDPKCKDMTDKEFFDLVKAEAAKYADGWKDVIFIYADN